MRATTLSWRAFRRAEPGSPEARVWRISATLMPVLILNNFFGNTFMIYSVAPIGWLLIGWISAEHLRTMAAVAPSAAREVFTVVVGEDRERFAI